MNTTNAFIGVKEPPSHLEIAKALGKSACAWEEFLTWLTSEDVTEQEWKSVSVKYGWALRLKRKQRTIIYLAPCDNGFTASFVLGAKAVEAARNVGLPENILALLDTAPRYAEGIGLRIPIQTEGDIVAIKKLTRIKLSN